MNEDKIPFLMYLKFFFTFILFSFSLFSEGRPASSQPLILQVKNRDIVVNGKTSRVFQIVQPNGTQSLSLQKGEQFYVSVENQIDKPTGIHWHGLILPNNQDGVPFVTQPAIPPGEKYLYNFPLIQSGTFWMHAHYGLQEQLLLSAPLILHETTTRNSNQQEVVMFLSDFTFRNPIDIFNELQSEGSVIMSHEMSNEQQMNMNRDLNDVKYDAFLTNWRTLSDPTIIEVAPEKDIRLRIINGSSSTNFFILLGKLTGEAIAIDGSDIHPLKGSQFEVGTAQRIDILIKLPPNSGVYPIIAQGEGLDMQTGLILAMPTSKVPQFQEKAERPMGACSYKQEFFLKAKNPLPKKSVDRQLILNLNGNMTKYIWTLNGKAWPNNEPLFVKEGERVELIFVNQTSMAHPMHLHGHFFQVTEIDGQPLEGALRDTMLVLPKSIVKVQFDANNPGNWPLHCHNLYHQYAGMMTTLNYEGFKGPTFSKEDRLRD
jgi:FtsP/CotA-like multicopper oxidase with cupredoxin domain